MQRVRIGLTGLAFVFLAVLLAAVFTKDPVAEQRITANLIERERAGEPAASEADQPAGPAEPLAELGVAPGKAATNNAATAPARPVDPAPGH